MAETGNARLPGAPFGIEARENSGEWQPFFDWYDVYSGNRWKDRHGQFSLFAILSTVGEEEDAHR